MKKIFCFSFITLFLVLIFIQVGTTSCTKDKTIYDTVAITKRDTLVKVDTLVIKDTTLTTNILVANPWKIQETRGVSGGNILYYLRGGSTNTQSYDNEYLQFNADGTGIHVDNNGGVLNITWQFTNAAHTKLAWTVYNTPSTFVINWDNVRYKNNSLYFDEYYTDGNSGTNIQVEEIRIPK